MDITVTQISLLSFSLSSLPHKPMLAVSMQTCPSADLGDRLAGTERGRRASACHGAHVLHGSWDLGWRCWLHSVKRGQFTEPAGASCKDPWRICSSAPWARDTAETMSTVQSAPCLVSVGGRNEALLLVPIWNNLCECSAREGSGI